MLGLCALAPVGAQAFEYPLGHIPLSVNGYLEGRAIAAFDKDTPREKPSAMFSLTAKASQPQWEALVTLEGLYDGKVDSPHNGRLFCELDKVFQDKNPSLNIDEAYLDLFTGRADIRIGIQKFAWGRLDEINPTDNLNPEDATDPLLQNENERKIGVPAVKASLYSDIVNCELAWIPRYCPYRLPMPDERWFPPILRGPAAIETGTVMGTIPVKTVYTDIDLPPLRLANSEAGIRLTKATENGEFSVSYFTGYDPMPVVGVPTELIVDLPNPLALKTDILAQVRVEPRLHRMQVFGLDFSTTVKGFTVRGEGAFYQGKYYCRTLESIYPEVASKEQQDRIMEAFLKEFLATGQTRQSFPIEPPAEWRSDALKYGLGIDYVRGDTTISVQCIQEHLLNYDEDTPLYLIKHGWDTILTMAAKRFFLQNTLELTIAGVYDIQFAHWLFQPSAAYSLTDNIKATLGALIIQGQDVESLLGQFRDNDELFCKLRYSF